MKWVTDTSSIARSRSHPTAQRELIQGAVGKRVSRCAGCAVGVNGVSDKILAVEGNSNEVASDLSAWLRVEDLSAVKGTAQGVCSRGYRSDR